MWKNNFKKKDQIYYDNILYIIDENFDIKFPNYIKNKNTFHQGIYPNYIINVVKMLWDLLIID